MAKLNKNAQKLVDALRSGKYKQTKHALHTVADDGYCCLGVACDVYEKETGKTLTRSEQTMTIGPNNGRSRRVTTFDGEPFSLPQEVQDFYNFRTDCGSFKKPIENAYSLDMLNDAGENFDTIADFIESKPEGLFDKSK